MVTNSRFFGHYKSAVELQGGAHTLLSNNIFSASSLRACGNYSGVLVKSNVSDFILQGNHIGNVFGGRDQGPYPNHNPNPNPNPNPNGRVRGWVCGENVPNTVLNSTGLN